MRIGLDFDGVVSNCGQLKSDWGKHLYGIEIPPERFKKELVVDKGILTLEQYRFLQKKIFNTREISLTILLVKGVLEFVSKLQQEGHDLTIITSRKELGVKIAKEWIKLKGLNLEIIGVGGINKTEACKGLDVYIDDDLDKLEKLVGVVPHLYLFSWGYNEHIQIPRSVAKRIESWKDFYEEILNLNGRQRAN